MRIPLSNIWKRNLHGGGNLGGARNVGTKKHTMDRYTKVRELLSQAEPKVGLLDALKRFGLPISTYYRLKAKYGETA